jgi:hypothetical protein
VGDRGRGRQWWCVGEGLPTSCPVRQFDPPPPSEPEALAGVVGFLLQRRERAGVAGFSRQASSPRTRHRPAESWPVSATLRPVSYRHRRRRPSVATVPSIALLIGLALSPIGAQAACWTAQSRRLCRTELPHAPGNPPSYRPSLVPSPPLQFAWLSASPGPVRAQFGQRCCMCQRSS